MICSQCGQDKVAGDFYWTSTGKVKSKQRCKSCHSIWLKSDEMKFVRQNIALRSNYGISLEEYNELLAKQNGKCAICEKESEFTKTHSKLGVDHDHKTGKVRGLLCHRCNVGIGFLAEDLNRIYKVLDYLNFHTIGEQK